MEQKTKIGWEHSLCEVAADTIVAIKFRSDSYFSFKPRLDYMLSSGIFLFGKEKNNRVKECGARARVGRRREGERDLVEQGLLRKSTWCPQTSISYSFPRRKMRRQMTWHEVTWAVFTREWFWNVNSIYMAPILKPKPQSRVVAFLWLGL